MSSGPETVPAPRDRARRDRHGGTPPARRLHARTSPTGLRRGDADAALSAHLEQQLAWGGCEGTATSAADAELFANTALECASVEVPLDYDEPEGERARIALMRLPAAGEAEGSLLVDPGGPGGSGTGFVAMTVPLWQASPVAGRFDIVGFDPRGIGSSTPALDSPADRRRCTVLVAR